MKNSCWIFLIVIIILSGLCVWLYNNPREIKTNTVEVYRDTLYIKEVVKDTVPKLVYTKIKEIQIDTLYSVDSIPVPVYVPIDQKLYSNTLNLNNDQDTLTYNAYVSGYKASLDSIDFDLRYRIINTNTVITKDKKQKWADNFSIGIQTGFGYGVFNKEPDLYIGIGINYKLTK